MKSSKRPIRLNVDRLNQLQEDQGINDSELSKLIGVSHSTLWRVRLPVDDERYNAPGESFIAGILHAFPQCKFEDLFFLDSALRDRRADGIRKLKTG